MKKKFKWGIIGTGGIANAFANDLQHLDNHVVESVLSRDLETAKKFSSIVMTLNNQHQIINIKFK